MSNTSQLSAMQRIQALLDENSFVEIGALVTRRTTDFNMQEKSVPTDGVITGYGMIDSRLVYIYSQDAACLGGTIGEMHAKKIVHMYDMALKVGAPVIGLIDCAGLRLAEATDALAAFGELYRKKSLASGVVLQLSAVFGSCGGGAAVMAQLSDFTFMEEKNAKLFVTAPNAVAGNYVGKCDTAAAAFQAENGAVDCVGKGEEEVLAKLRSFVTLLPDTCEENVAYTECNDDLNRLVPTFASNTADSVQALSDISDNHFFFEIKAMYAKEMVCGFIRLNGMTVGAVANRTAIMDENGKAAMKFDALLTSDGCYKAAEFVGFCDSFDIPVLTLTNVCGFAATLGEEKKISKAAAKLTYAFANATIPKINLIVGKAFGSAYITMNSKHIGADMVFALNDSQVGTMDAKLAAEVMYGKENATDEKVAEYSALQLSSESAAKRGYIDAIIDPEETRKHVAYAFDMLFTKTESRPSKKHGTI